MPDKHNPEKNAPDRPSQKNPEQKKAEQEEKRVRQQAMPAGGNGEQTTDPAAGDSVGKIRESDKPDQNRITDAGFPVVGIGASAGGLEPLEAFAAALPEQSGIAFVVIAHSHPEHATMLPKLLERKSKAAVRLAEDGMALAPDTIYIPPSDRDAVVENGTLRLQKRESRTEVHMPIDVFFKSLAEDRGEAAGCVILSGTGTDGTGGLRRIKEEAGVTVAQSMESARHPGMPRSAIDTGLVDYVLEPADMPERLIEYFRHPATLRPEKEKEKEKEKGPDVLNQILSFLADRTRHDFSLYKKSTLVRRIERRMNVTRSETAPAYYRHLHRHPDEIQALFQDLLIGVTNFFRDPEVFAFLKEKVLPDLLSRSDRNDSFRVWVPGCATGEEAYSVAILVKECMESLRANREMQIFATDIDPRAIEKARVGLYPQNIALDVSPERLKRFFTSEENYYRIKKEIREPTVFAEQNVLRDPPFMNLNLLVCRNLLIYLEPKAQNKLLPLFHYNLKPGGILFLGTSESTGRFSDLFEPVSKKFSIYRKKQTVKRQGHVHFPVGDRKLRHAEQAREHKREADTAVPDDARIQHAVEHKLLREQTPACVIVNRSGDVVYIHGRTGKYLEHAQGKPSNRLVDMAREGLRYALSATLRRAAEKNETVREYGLSVKTNGSYAVIDLTVEPLRESSLENCFMVLFRDAANRTTAGPPPSEKAEKRQAPEDEEGRRIAELERELENLRQDYRSTVEELETSNEELKSSNEELYSSNEELQSTNEELESSREELESLNEELSTVNSELHDKISEVQEAYNRITTVLNSTGIAIVFLDNDLEVTRFTQEATRLINLIDKDVGRPIDHISHNLEYNQLTKKIRQVLSKLSPFEEDVRTADGSWYQMRIMLHRSEKNVIEGAVLTFINIDTQKKAQEKVEQFSSRSVSAARQFAESIIDTVRESLLVLDGQKKVIMANRRFYETFRTSPDQTEGRNLYELGNGQWDIPALRHRLEALTDQKKAFEDYEVTHRSDKGEEKRLLLNARLLREETTQEMKILLAIDDITGRRS